LPDEPSGPSIDSSLGQTILDEPSRPSVDPSLGQTILAARDKIGHLVKSLKIQAFAQHFRR
jgi:hypothetical protein